MVFMRRSISTCEHGNGCFIIPLDPMDRWDSNGRFSCCFLYCVLQAYSTAGFVSAFFFFFIVLICSYLCLLSCFAPAVGYRWPVYECFGSGIFVKMRI